MCFTLGDAGCYVGGLYKLCHKYVTYICQILVTIIRKPCSVQKIFVFILGFTWSCVAAFLNKSKKISLEEALQTHLSHLHKTEHK